MSGGDYTLKGNEISKIPLIEVKLFQWDFLTVIFRFLDKALSDL